MRLKILPVLVMTITWMAASCAPQPAAIPAAAAPTAGTAAEVAPPLPSTAAHLEEMPVADSHEPIELIVFAASSLSEPFIELGSLFEASHPGVSVVFNFSGSQQLARQIREGAPADVFASANRIQMDEVIAGGDILGGSSRTFAENILVVIYPEGNPAGLIELHDLAKPNLKLVFAAQEAPVGQYTLDFLDKARADPAFGEAYRDRVLNNVVSYEDNVKAVLTKVVLGETDGGIVYRSDISSAKPGSIGWIDISAVLNVVASYPIAPVKDGANIEMAQSFIDLVLSPEGLDILAKYHFIPAAR